MDGTFVMCLSLACDEAVSERVRGCCNVMWFQARPSTSNEGIYWYGLDHGEDWKVGSSPVPPPHLYEVRYRRMNRLATNIIGR